MAVALIHPGIGGEAIQVAMALRIPDKDALAARQNDAERFVVPGAKARFPRDEISDRWYRCSVTSIPDTMSSWFASASANVVTKLRRALTKGRK